MTPVAYEEKIAALEEELRRERASALSEAGRANRAMDLLDRILEECDVVDDIACYVEQAKHKRAKGGILLPRALAYLAKHDINRFEP